MGVYITRTCFPDVTEQKIQGTPSKERINFINNVNILILDADHTWIYILCCVGGVFVIGAVVMATMLHRRFVARSKYEQFDWPEADIEHFDSKYT